MMCGIICRLIIALACPEYWIRLAELRRATISWCSSLQPNTVKLVYFVQWSGEIQKTSIPRDLISRGKMLKRFRNGFPSNHIFRRYQVRITRKKFKLNWKILLLQRKMFAELETILFLHSCYYSLEQAKKTIDIYYTIRTHSPEFFAKRDTSASEILDMMEIQWVYTKEKMFCGPINFCENLFYYNWPIFTLLSLTSRNLTLRLYKTSRTNSTNKQLIFIFYFNFNFGAGITDECSSILLRRLRYCHLDQKLS